MMINENFVFTVSLSVDSYLDKKDATESIATLELAKKHGHQKKMSFKHQTLDVDLFEQYIKSGYSYCGGLFFLNPDYEETFTTKDGGKYTSTPYYKDDDSLKAQFKSDRYFTSGQVISIDIDETRFTSPESYVSALTLKPTFYYTSPSDNPDGLRKFRLVYIFEQLLNKDGYELATKAIHKQAEVDTIEKVKDNCGERFSQYFNGNRNAQIWTTYNIIQAEDLKPIIEKYQIGLDERTEKEELFSSELITALETLSYKEFMHFNSLKYEYFWNSVCFEPDEKYRILDPSRDIVLLFRWGEKFKDGEGRRKRLQKYAALRRIARPWITPDQLLFNLYVDRERFFDNSDGAITLDCLKRKVEIAFSKTPEELREDYSYVMKNCPLKFVINPKVILKQKAINEAKKEIHWKEIKDNYDITKSVKDNLQELKAKGIKVGKTVLYEFCKEYGIATNPEIEDKRNKILEIYDSSLSLRKNVEILNKRGIDIKKTELSRLVSLSNSDLDSEEDKSDTDYITSDAGVYICCLDSSNIILETEKCGQSDYDSLFGPLVLPRYKNFDFSSNSAIFGAG